MSRVRRGVVGLGVLSLVVAAAVSPPATTLATWNDGESGSGSYSAKTIPAPTVTACNISNTLGIFQSVTLVWTPPTGSGYTASNFSVGTGATAGTVQPVVPQPTISGPAGGPYSATFSSGLLQSILGGLFGTTFSIGVRSTENGWTSAWSTRTVDVGLLGFNTTCT